MGFPAIFFTRYRFFYFSSKLKGLIAYRSIENSKAYVSHTILVNFKMLPDWMAWASDEKKFLEMVFPYQVTG